MEKYVSPQTKLLSKALIDREVEIMVEYWDKYKHVDIAIPKAKIFIEVDGMHHYTNAEQIKTDFKRDHFSDGDDFNTIRIPNELIDSHLNEIADAITQVVKERALEAKK